MVLRATMSYAGALHSAGKGTVFEVGDELAERLLAEGYPVEPVGASKAQEGGGDGGEPKGRKPAAKRAAGRKPAADGAEG